MRWGGAEWGGVARSLLVGWGGVKWGGMEGGSLCYKSGGTGGEGDRMFTKVVEVGGERVNFVTKVWGGRGFTLLQKLWQGWGSRCCKTCGDVGG